MLCGIWVSKELFYVEEVGNGGVGLCENISTSTIIAVSASPASYANNAHSTFAQNKLKEYCVLVKEYQRYHSFCNVPALR